MVFAPFSIYETLYRQPWTVLLGLVVVGLWTVLWQGLGLWQAAKNRQKGWVISLLILNTLGLLPIIYLLWFRGKQQRQAVSEEQKEASAAAAVAETNSTGKKRKKGKK